jgi:hypothetical protein
VTAQEAQAIARKGALDLGVGLNPKPIKKENKGPQLGDEFGVELENLKPKLREKRRAQRKDEAERIVMQSIQGYKPNTKDFLNKYGTASKEKLIEELSRYPSITFNKNSSTETLRQTLLQGLRNLDIYRMDGGGSPRYHGQRFADALFLSFL